MRVLLCGLCIGYEYPFSAFVTGKKSYFRIVVSARFSWLDIPNEVCDEIFGICLFIIFKLCGKVKIKWGFAMKLCKLARLVLNYFLVC